MSRSCFLRLALAALALPVFAADIPRPAPELKVQFTDGTSKPLSTWKGKVVVLQFFYTTCPHCQDSTVVLNKIQTKYGARGVQVVNVAFNGDAAKLLKDFAADYKTNHVLGYTDTTTPNGFMQLSVMRPAYVPFLALIDRTGTIRAQWTGENEFFKTQEKSLSAEIDKLLTGGKPAAAAGKSAPAAPAKSAPAKAAPAKK